MIRNLDTGYFSVVMSLGIISVSLEYHGYPVASIAFLVAGTAFYILLSALFLIRIVLFPDNVVREASERRSLMGYFNVLTATGVLLGRYTAVSSQYSAQGVYIMAAAAIALAVMLFRAFTGSSAQGARRSLDSSNFTMMVASESISIAFSIIYGTGYRDPLTMWAPIVLWASGILLFMPVCASTVMSAARGKSPASEILGQFWISMGGGAIITLSGLLLHNDVLPGHSFTLAVSGIFLAWSMAWFFPVAALALRLVLRSFRKISYSAGMWSMVFPTGMLSAASYRYGAYVHDYSVVDASYGFLAIAIAILVLVGSSYLFYHSRMITHYH